MSKSVKLNILVAFPYFSQNIYKFLMDKDPSTFRLIVDSGAFTAWNTGKHISMEDYCKFLKTIPSHWEYKAVQLDVYGNPEQTYTNYLRMLDAGYKDVMPVFTRGDTVERLEEFYSYTDYIMFGGIAIGGENKNYVKWFCEVNKSRHAHWLGFVNVPFIKHYKPYSVDSSSAYSAQRFGNLQYYVGAGQLKTINRKDCAKRPPQSAINYLMKSGFTLKEILTLQNQDAWEGGAHPPNNNPKGLASFITVTNHLRRAIDVENNVGTKVYLAFGNDSQLQNVYDSLQLLKERKVIK
jgi:hypothetical protein